METRRKSDYPDAEWLDDPCKLRWVREATTMASSPNYKVKDGKHRRVIGRDKMKKIMPHIYEGIFWWVGNGDFAMYQGEHRPTEAVKFEVD